ncbi:MAG: PHP domain-containing protein [Chloroflexota bacterium]
MMISRKEYRTDLHVHSCYSHDGVMEPREIIELARKSGLTGVAVTDHDTIAGGEHASRLSPPDISVIIGAEIMTDKGEVIGLFLREEIRSRRLMDVIAEIRSQDGLVIVPHPFDALRSSAFPITDDLAPAVDAIEGLNARCILGRYNRQAVNFATRHGLAVVGGSDAHYPGEVGAAGVITDSPDIRQAILDRRVTLFGNRTSLFNHARTKVRKLYRATRE